MQKQNINISKTRFYSLDIIRGIAALSVVFWHWQHFWFQGTINHHNYQYYKQPFYNIFYLFYNKGYISVDLFFALSGFIFFWLYAQKIQNKSISANNFFILRFSRLYPLHILSLLVVAILQLISTNTNTHFVVYKFNDWYHFLLNIFFIQTWGWQQGYSFNGPSWSVSIEVMMYMIFFILAYFNKAKSLYITLLIVFLSIYFQHYLNSYVYRGLVSFFMGGAIFIIYQKLNRYKYNIIPFILGIMTLILWSLVFINYSVNISRIMHLSTQISDWITKYYAVILLFPTTILSITVIETYWKISFIKKVKFIGDISYSSYLLHFPLQMIIIIIINIYDINKNIFYSNFSLILFFMILIPISYLCFQYFEKPAQKYIRGKYIN